MLRFYIALFCAKGIQLALRLLGRNATYLAGKVAIKLCPDFLGRIGKPETVIGVTGTNGKTTCCNLLVDTMTRLGYDVLNNRFGSNINAGVATALLSGATLRGRAKKKIAVLELDERSSRLIYPYVKPDYLVVTNLFRDSMRRNAHTEFIRDLLAENIPESTRLILNADDLICSSLSRERGSVYFGIAPMAGEGEPYENIVNDMAVCPVCDTRLEYDLRRYNHIGRAHCPHCGFKSPEPDYLAENVDFETMSMTVGGQYYRLVSRTLFNIYNELAVIALLRELSVDGDSIARALSDAEIVKSRFWEETIGGRQLTVLMAKGLNAVACSRTFDFVAHEPGTKAVVLMLDDVFDERESSENIAWIYDADYELLNSPDIRQVVVGGVRCLDHRLRLLIAGLPEKRVAAVPECDIARELELRDVERVYLLYELYRHDEAVVVREDIAEKMRGAAK